MKKVGLIFLIVFMLIMQSFLVSALSASDAKTKWLNAKKDSREAKSIHNDAKLDFAVDKSEENKQDVIDTGKDLLHAALNEAEAWLNWKDLEVKEDSRIPSELKEAIQKDIVKSLGKVSELKTDVDNVDTQLELALVALKMVGKYIELVTDVARNTGRVLIHVAGIHVETAKTFEAKLRATANDLSDNETILDSLDKAKDDIANAKENISDAKEAYELVVTPGKPLIKFAEGNNNLRTARTNLLSAHANLRDALRMILKRGE